EHQFSIVQQNTFPCLYIFWEIGIIHIYLLRIPFKGQSRNESNLIARCYHHFLGHNADPQFWTLQIGKDRGIGSQFVIYLTDHLYAFRNIIIIGMGKVYPKDIHSCLDHVPKNILLTSSRSSCSCSVCLFLYWHSIKILNYSLISFYPYPRNKR